MNNAKKGFTLVELLVVIAILAILATVSVVGYTSFIKRANDSNATTEIHQVETTINSYRISGQEYAIGKDATNVYYAQIDANGNVTVCTKATTNGVTKYTAVAASVVTAEGFEWTDFESIASKLTLNGSNQLVYVYGETGSQTTVVIDVID